MRGRSVDRYDVQIDMASNTQSEIAAVRARLKELDAERDALGKQLERLGSESNTGAACESVSTPVTVSSTAAEKIALFRRLLPVGRMSFHCVGRTATRENQGMRAPVRTSGSAACAVNQKSNAVTARIPKSLDTLLSRLPEG
jgi:hypothetical protein